MPFLFIVVSKDCDIAQLDINTSASMIPNSIFIVLGFLLSTYEFSLKDWVTRVMIY
jgi:hypothetical protein